MKALKAKGFTEMNIQETYYNIHCAIDKVNEYQKKIPERIKPVLLLFFLIFHSHFSHALPFHFQFDLLAGSYASSNGDETRVLWNGSVGLKTKKIRVSIQCIKYSVWMLSKTSSSSSSGSGYIHQQQSNDTTTQWIEAVFQIKCIATSEQTDAEWDKAFRLKMCITFIHTCIYLISECISLSNHTILRYEYDVVFFLLKDPEKWLMAHRTKWLNLVSAMSTVLNWFYLLAEFLYIFFFFYFFCFWLRFYFGSFEW